MAESPKPTVFVSYSHADEAWKDRLVTHLTVLERQGLLDLWDDSRIGAGEDWRREIQAAMERACVAVLLVSADFLTSDFVLDEAVPRLLQRRDMEGLRVFPVVVRPCAWKRVEWLARMQVRPRDACPLSAGDDHQIDADLAAVAEEVAGIISPALEASESPTASELRRFLDEDFQRLENALHDVWVALSGDSPIVKYSATSNWKTITSRSTGIPEDIHAVFDKVVETRELASGGTSKLTREQLSSAKQGVKQVLRFLRERFPSAGVEPPALPSAPPPSVAAETLAVHDKLDRLLEGQEGLREGQEDLQRGQAAIYRLDGAQRRAVEEVLNHLGQMRRDEAESSRELQGTLEAIRRVLIHLQAVQLPQLDEELHRALDEVTESVRADVDLHTGLELTVPLIPLLLNYMAALDVSGGLTCARRGST